MGGFEGLIYICAGVILLFVFTSIILKRKKYDKFIFRTFIGLLLLSIVIIMISFFVDGWGAIGIMLIGLSTFAGTLIGGFIFLVYFCFRVLVEKRVIGK